MERSAGSILILVCVGLLVVVSSFWITLKVIDNGSTTSDETAASREIHIVEASYGVNCIGRQLPAGATNKARSGNVTEFFEQQCARKETICMLLVDSNKIGDVAPGCFKDFKVTWTCGSANKIHELYLAPEAHGKAFNLSCPGLKS